MNNSRSGSNRTLSGSAEDGSDLIDWELRPGGMLVQKRDANANLAANLGPMLKLKVSHGLVSHGISVPAQASFGDLKKLLVQETGLQPQDQKILFRGKEKENGEYLQVAGVKDKAKLILVEDPASRERKLEELRNNERIARACKVVTGIKAEVDKLEEQLSLLEKNVETGSKVPESDFDMLTEMLMRQLLKLDSIEADGEAKIQRKSQVSRVQKFVEALDGLKTRSLTPNPFSSNTVVVTTSWETFDTGVGSLTAPPQTTSFTPTTDWERFD
ncbi:hypothetical protein O6H91_16G012200 [Diphasiastrum complanatum]|uniref:Uncharacterized protein n=1 Tax=Diphasiastrum complanatum TaxID=34168 RepID=A0ACC2B9V5_DIPCM|nr:hypothetical protein O6H91_16G012200 [Diphasiastrum complanatum]